MKSRTPACALAIALATLLAGCAGSEEAKEDRMTDSAVHYVEIVCRDVAAECAALERMLGVRFGEPVADLGQARVAKAAGGSLIGVRAPLAEHETPVTRTYFAVADIGQAIKNAEASGAIVAYPPTRQGDTGTWAICFIGDVQIGLWQR
jgi:predicted enzyme related to lactoylglutathione lyase